VGFRVKEAAPTLRDEKTAATEWNNGEIENRGYNNVKNLGIKFTVTGYVTVGVVIDANKIQLSLV
jgi:hypothetical protein